MPTFAPVPDQLALIESGVVDFLVRAELAERLEESRKTGRPLRIKAGFDPTRPDLHVGHAVLLQKIRVFQDLGHTAIFLIGDFTAMVGDPTGHNDSRPPRSNARRRPTSTRPSRSSTPTRRSSRPRATATGSTSCRWSTRSS
jgi:tyrosyl-tRNA synthetase